MLDLYILVLYHKYYNRRKIIFIITDLENNQIRPIPVRTISNQERK